MATARDVLLVELQKLLKGAYSERASSSLMAILERFRVQSKGGPDAQSGTARELMMAQLNKCWQEGSGLDLGTKLTSVLNQFRMQLKQSGEQKNEAKVKAKVLSKTPVVKAKAEPVAGGPQKRQRIRGECPKCHSMGVVLARSYSGDEYFSCIYCGYQNHRSAMDLEFDLPLAAELLNRRFDEKQGVKET